MTSDQKLTLKFLNSPKSALPQHKATLSESRYNSRGDETGETGGVNEAENFQTIQGFCLKDIIPNKENTHIRGLSQPIDVLTPELLFGHKRQQSLGQRPIGQVFDTSQGATPKLEDVEVENFKYSNHSRKISDCDIVVYADNREMITSNDVLRRSLPVFGSNPCTAYCKDCNREVHTRVEFAKKTNIPFSFLDFISSFFACCGEPTWLLKLRVHKCEECNKVLARICN
ncbi:hypothetical protein SteCoe_21470 [Stentor coeruleus]|uniref:LITAF domain-containing protein n=1 Tax=Stentor coeruleus TaxID=5963 RepID=A0A1R2BPK1_9CILI|nr:hypothetical protein SteCoe_21470 [Stentor coeruleus]